MDGVILKPFLHENIGCFQKFEALKPSISLKWLLPNLLDAVSEMHTQMIICIGRGKMLKWLFFFFKVRNQTYGKYAYSYYDRVSTSEYIYTS